MKIERANSLLKLKQPQALISQRSSISSSLKKNGLRSEASSCPYKTFDKKETFTPRLPPRKSGHGFLSLSSPHEEVLFSQATLS